MTWRLAVSPEASADLEEIRQYTAEKFGAEQARSYVRELRAALEQLTVHPSSGKPIAPSAEIRCWIHRGHYRVLYRLRDERLEVGRIIHAAREEEYQRALDYYLRRRD